MVCGRASGPPEHLSRPDSSVQAGPGSQHSTPCLLIESGVRSVRLSTVHTLVFMDFAVEKGKWFLSQFRNRLCSPVDWIFRVVEHAL